MGLFGKATIISTERQHEPGRELTDDACPCAQETPVGKRVPGSGNYIFFDNTIHVQTSLNKLGSKCAIFFEFRHYKADKKKVRAWVTGC